MTTVLDKLREALDDAPYLTFAVWNGAKLYFVSLRPDAPQGERAFVAEVSADAVLGDPTGSVSEHILAASAFWAGSTGPCEVCGRPTPRHRLAPCDQCFEGGRI